MLARSTLRCRKSFETCLTASSAADKEWLINRLADFDLWAAGIGAAVDHSGSLDHRLKDRSDLAEVISTLIETIYKTTAQMVGLGDVDLA